MHENVFAGMYTMGDRLEPIVDNSLFQGGGRGGEWAPKLSENGSSESDENTGNKNYRNTMNTENAWNKKNKRN